MLGWCNESTIVDPFAQPGKWTDETAGVALKNGKLPVLFHLYNALDTAQCCQIERSLRWPQTLACLACHSQQVVKNGKPARQHYRCSACGRYFDALNETILACSHQTLTPGITTLYLLNLNISVARMAAELEVREELVQTMGPPSEKVLPQKPVVVLDQNVAFDETHLIADYKIQINRELISFLLSFGADLEVLAPIALRTSIHPD